MELDELDAAGILHPHDGVRQALGHKGLAHAGRTLEDDVLLMLEQGNELAIGRLGKVDLGQEVRVGIPRIIDLGRFGLDRVVLDIEQRLDLIDLVGEHRDVGQGLGRHVPGELPAPAVRPFDPANISVIIITGFIEYGFRRDHAPAHKSGLARLGEDDIPRLHIVNELPERQSRVGIRRRAAEFALKAGFQVGPGLKGSRVTDLAPADRHDVSGIELIPFRGEGTG